MDDPPVPGVAECCAKNSSDVANTSYGPPGGGGGSIIGGMSDDRESKMLCMVDQANMKVRRNESANERG